MITCMSKGVCVGGIWLCPIQTKVDEKTQKSMEQPAQLFQ
jgi:hypothetical protein